MINMDSEAEIKIWILELFGLLAVWVLATVVDRIMALWRIHALIPGTFECVTPLGRRHFADGIKARILRRGDYLGFSRWAQCHHRHPCKRDVESEEMWWWSEGWEREVKERGRDRTERERERESYIRRCYTAGFEDGQGAVSQGMQVAVRSWKKRGKEDP